MHACPYNCCTRMYVINVICQSSACRETESGESLQRVTRVQRDIERKLYVVSVSTNSHSTRARRATTVVSTVPYIYLHAVGEGVALSTQRTHSTPAPSRAYCTHLNPSSIEGHAGINHGTRFTRRLSLHTSVGTRRGESRSPAPPPGGVADSTIIVENMST